MKKQELVSYTERRDILEFLILLEDNKEKLDRWVKEYNRINKEMGVAI